MTDFSIETKAAILVGVPTLVHLFHKAYPQYIEMAARAVGWG